MAEAAEAVVVDASVATKWHLRDEQGADKALLLLRRFMQGHAEVWAPNHIRYEVPAAIARATRGSRPRVAPSLGRQAIEAFLALGLHTLDTDELILQAYALAHQYGCSFYDTLYLALAERLSVSLLTADESFYHAVRSHPLVVRMADYSPPDEN